MNSSINASSLIIDEQEKRTITQEEAEQAIKILIEYIGEDPNREGLMETPKRVIKSFNEFYAGYNQDPKKLLEKTFEDILPSTVLGSNDLYLQFRMKVSKDRHSFSTPAQFGRSDANANKDIFYLDANYSSDMDEEKMLLLMEL